MPGTGFLNDLANELLPGTGAQSIVPQVATSTVTGAAVDLLETDGPCFAFLALGTVSGTAPTLALKMTEAATSGGTYADITGATLATQVASSKFLVLTFKRSMRFVKAVATFGGTTPSFAVACLVVGQKKAI